MLIESLLTSSTRNLKNAKIYLKNLKIMDKEEFILQIKRRENKIEKTREK